MQQILTVLFLALSGFELTYIFLTCIIAPVLIFSISWKLAGLNEPKKQKK